MSDSRLNPRIFQVLKEKCDDEIVTEFLNDILITETDNDKGWWFREYYNDKLDEYIKKWSDNSEDG